MTGSKMLNLVMPSQYRQGYSYPTKGAKVNIITGKKSHKSLGHPGKVIKKLGKTMLRRALKRDMLNQID